MNVLARRSAALFACVVCLFVSLSIPTIAFASAVAGFRVAMPDGNPNPTAPQLAAVIATTVYVDGVPQTPASMIDPFSYSLGAGTHQISTSLPGAGWRVGYTYCRNGVDCVDNNSIDTRPITPGASFSVTLAANEWIDMRWYYIPPPITAPGTDPSTYLHIADSRWGNFFFAYSPSIILENGIYHAFFCSRGGLGLASGRVSWDFIRHTQSSDGGATWSTPTIVLTDLGTADPTLSGYTPDQGFNASACDPSVVYWQGYYYMFFGSGEDTGAPPNPKPIFQTVIEVARATNIAGPYSYYREDGTWGIPTTANRSKAIIRPMVAHPGVPQYGAGQPSVVVRNNKLYMWYTDSTVVPVTTSAFMLESTDPVQWQPDPLRVVVAQGSVTDNDFRYDPISDRFVIYRIEWSPVGTTENSHVTASYSTDGLNWPAFRTIVPAGQFPQAYAATGLSSDPRGYLTPGSSTIIGISSPYDMNTLPMVFNAMNWARWDLNGFKLPTVSTTLAAGTFSGWPGFNFGSAGDKPFVMRLNGKLVPVVFRPSTAYWFLNTDGFVDDNGANIKAVSFGQAGDLPQIVQYNGVDRMAVYRPSSNQLIVNTDNETYHGTNVAVLPAQSPLVPAAVSQIVSIGSDAFNGSWNGFVFGLPGDVPMLIQLQAGGARLPVVYDATTGVWSINLAGYANPGVSQIKNVQWGGVPGDVPRIVQWNGGDHIAVVRPGVGTVVSIDNESFVGSNAVIIP